MNKITQLLDGIMISTLLVVFLCLMTWGATNYITGDGTYSVAQGDTLIGDNVTATIDCELLAGNVGDTTVLILSNSLITLSDTLWRNNRTKIVADSSQVNGGVSNFPIAGRITSTYFDVYDSCTFENTPITTPTDNGQAHKINWNRCVFINCGKSHLRSKGATDHIYVDSCLFDSCAAFFYEGGNNAANWWFTNNTWIDPTSVDSAVYIPRGTMTGTSKFENNVIYCTSIKNVTISLSTCTIKNNVFVNVTFPLYNANSPFIDNFWYAKGANVGSKATTTKFMGNVIITNQDNPHTLLPADPAAKIIGNIGESIYPTITDNGDYIIFDNTTAVGTSIVAKNIILTSKSDVLIQNLTANCNRNIQVYKNTLVGNFNANSSLARTEGAGYHHPDSSVEMWNNAIFSLTYTVGSFGVYNDPAGDGDGLADQWDYLDHNGWFQLDDKYYDVVITGKTEGVTDGFGLYDITTNPMYKDSSINFVNFDLSMGYDGNPDSAAKRFAFKAHTLPKFKGIVRSKLIPRNAAYIGSGRYGDDISAVTVPLTHIDTIISNDTCYSIDSVSADLSFYDTTGGYRDSLRVFNYKKSAGSYVYSDSTGLIRGGTRCTTAVKAIGALDTFIVFVKGSKVLGDSFFTDTLPIITFETGGESQPDTSWGFLDTIWVDSTLTDSTTTYSFANRNGSGSNGVAYKSLHWALAAHTKGTCIVMRGGTYKCEGNRFELPSTSNGTAWSVGEYNEIRSADGEIAILDGENGITTATWTAVLGSGSARNYWKFERLEIKNGRSLDNQNARGFIASDGPFIFRYCYFHDILCDVDGNVPAALGGHTWNNSLVEYCYFKNNGSSTVSSANIGHIIIYGDYLHDTWAGAGFTFTAGEHVYKNEFRYNIFEGMSMGIRDCKSVQFFTGRAAANGYDDTYKDYGDKIHHNVFIGLNHWAIEADQDFQQVYSNIIVNCAGGIKISEPSKTMYKQCIYNNTIRNAPSIGIFGYQGYSYDIEGRVPEDMYHTWVINNILDSCTHVDTWEKEEIAFGAQDTFITAKQDSIVIDRNYSYRPALHDNDNDGTRIIFLRLNKITTRYTVSSWLSFKPLTEIWLNAYNADNLLYQSTDSTSPDSYKTNGSHILDGSSTISNSGTGGNHPYLSGVTIPGYVGATDPSNDGWVDSVLWLRDTFAEPEPVIDPPVVTVDPVSDTTTGTVTMSASWTGDSVRNTWYRFHGTDTILMSSDSVLQFTATPAMHGDSIAVVLWNTADTVMSAKAGIYFVYAVFDSVNTGDSNMIYTHGNFLSGSGWTATLSDSILTTIDGSATNQSFIYNHKITLSTNRYQLVITNGVYTITDTIGTEISDTLLISKILPKKIRISSDSFGLDINPKLFQFINTTSNDTDTLVIDDYTTNSVDFTLPTDLDTNKQYILNAHFGSLLTTKRFKYILKDNIMKLLWR